MVQKVFQYFKIIVGMWRLTRYVLSDQETINFVRNRPKKTYKHIAPYVGPLGAYLKL